ncbi:hypothetical protein N2152v2_002538 [Parachlorella kessleri]
MVTRWGEGHFTSREPEAARTLVAATYNRNYSDEASSSSSGWVPSWLKQRLPVGMGGSRGTDELEDLTLDKYAQGLKRARQLGGLTGWVHGSGKASDPAAQGSLRMYETIISAMTEDEKADLSLFTGAARERVAAQVGCRVAQVDDCIAKYLWMKHMTSKMAEMKAKGQELPSTVEAVEQTLGDWRQFKTQAGGGGRPTVPYGYKTAEGYPCALAGSDASRNTKCPRTRKAFKACCGKRLLAKT